MNYLWKSLHFYGFVMRAFGAYSIQASIVIRILEIILGVWCVLLGCYLWVALDDGDDDDDDDHLDGNDRS